MLNAPPYLVVVVLVAVVAALFEVAELRRQLRDRRGAHRKGVVTVAALLAQALLRPAAWAVLAVTGAWLIAMAVNGSVQMSGAAGVVAEPVAVGVAAALVLVAVPSRSAAAGARAKHGSGSAAAALAGRRPPRMARLAHEDFARWETELRVDPRGLGTGEIGDPLH